MLRSKLRLPREPRNRVGRSALRRGPSDAISRSAAKRSRLASHRGARPDEPVSSPISIRYLALNPSLPRASSTLAMACMFTECWPLLSAMPRPYQRPSDSVRVQGDSPCFHSESRPRMTSPWPYPNTVGSPGSSSRWANRNGALALGWVRVSAGESHRLEGGLHFIREVAGQHRRSLRVLAFGGNRDAACERLPECAGIEVTAGEVESVRAVHVVWVLPVGPAGQRDQGEGRSLTAFAG